VRRYAEDTSVPVAKSRGEIDKILREWGAQGVQWTDDWARDLVQLRFLWTAGGSQYLARFDVQLPKHAEVQAAHPNAPARAQTILEQGQRSAHRVLALWLKAAFNAVAAGIVDAETIFLPFLQGQDGATVAQVALPRLPKLLAGGANLLLPAKGEVLRGS
jgi:hypothetical protein